jgi:predicted adenylyl cyclase CyaB
MRETELKAVVPDEPACVERLTAAGARPVWSGRIEDRRYDYADKRLTKSDTVLRLRIQWNATGSQASLDWKGAASYDGGYKHRDEIVLDIGDAIQMANILEALGFIITRAIDREVRTFQLEDATLRFELYPRMDTLLEIEGPEAAIEMAIRATGLPRDSFNADRLWQFVQRFEARTGQRAAISDAELAGTYRYLLEDA